MKKGERGRIPNWAKTRAKEEIEKYGLDLAFHYFIYDCDTTDLKDWEIQLWRAFDRYQRIEEGIELKRYGMEAKNEKG